MWPYRDEAAIPLGPGAHEPTNVDGGTVQKGRGIPHGREHKWVHEQDRDQTNHRATEPEAAHQHYAKYRVDDVQQSAQHPMTQ